METHTFDVSGMTCEGCGSSVQRAISKLDGVTHADVTLHPGLAIVTLDPYGVTVARIATAVARVGYSAKVRP